MGGNLTGDSYRNDNEKIDVQKLEKKGRQLLELSHPQIRTQLENHPRRTRKSTEG